MQGIAKGPLASCPARQHTRPHKHFTFAQSTAVSFLAFQGQPMHSDINSCTAWPLVCCQQLYCKSAAYLSLPQLSFPVVSMPSSAQKHAEMGI